MKAIKCFMWGYQPLFRRAVESTAEHALQRVGLDIVDPLVLLVGFRSADGQVCIEPENGPFTSVMLKGVDNRAEQLYLDNPESKIMFSAPHLHELRHRDLRDRARGDAIAELLGATGAGSDMVFCCGRSAPIGGFEVYPILALPAELVSAVPQLKTAVRDRIPIARSLVHAVIDHVLGLATQALHLPDPGMGLGLPGGDAEEVARIAGETLTRSVAVLSGEPRGADEVFRALGALATSRYEGAIGRGVLTLCGRSGAATETLVVLKDPVSLRDLRTLRKLLEISEEGLTVLIDSQHAFGLGRIHSDYSAEEESHFSLRIVESGIWDVSHAGQTLMRVEHSIPHLPQPALGREQFIDVIARRFPTIDADADHLWGLVEAAKQQHHGTTIVISSRAQREAERLGGQALELVATRIDPEQLRQLSNIDGAVLLSPQGDCHAVGVILDGLATEEGDRGRGARFNSAVRYLASTDDAAVVVLVSEDGMIDLLPKLRPRIGRQQVADALAEASAESEKDPPDFERFYKAFRRVESLEFYLSEPQCSQANAIRERVEQHRGDAMRIGYRALRVNPEMSDKYYLD
jgi:hypothetical protein